MKRFLLFAAIACLAAACTEKKDTVYQFTVKGAQGEEVQLSDYRGKVLLIVNTATQCGFTPQYAELQALYQKYGEQGFEVLDFPCNQFGAQAPGTQDEIHEFCTGKYHISFTQFQKCDVNGDSQLPLFAFLKERQQFGGFDLENPLGKLLDEMLAKQDPDYALSSDIKWNFTKFLVTRKGEVSARFEPTAPMSEVEAAVADALKE